MRSSSPVRRAPVSRAPLFVTRSIVLAACACLIMILTTAPTVASAARSWRTRTYTSRAGADASAASQTVPVGAVAVALELEATEKLELEATEEAIAKLGHRAHTEFLRAQLQRALHQSESAKQPYEELQSKGFSDGFVECDLFLSPTNADRWAAEKEKEKKKKKMKSSYVNVAQPQCSLCQRLLRSIQDHIVPAAGGESSASLYDVHQAISLTLSLYCESSTNEVAKGCCAPVRRLISQSREVFADGLQMGSPLQSICFQARVCPFDVQKEVAKAATAKAVVEQEKAEAKKANSTWDIPEPDSES